MIVVCPFNSSLKTVDYDCVGVFDCSNVLPRGHNSKQIEQIDASHRVTQTTVFLPFMDLYYRKNILRFTFVINHLCIRVYKSVRKLYAQMSVFIIVIVGNLLIVNVYLPCAGSDNRLFIYKEVFENIMLWIDQYPDKDVICLLGIVRWLPLTT